MEQHGLLEMSADLLMTTYRPSNTNIRDGEKLAARLIESGKSFSAIVCTNDMMAIGAIQICKRYGMAVPQDVSIMGIDNAYIGKYISPSLTTMAVPYTEIGEKAVKLLYADLKDDLKGYSIVHSILKERESVMPVR